MSEIKRQVKVWRCQKNVVYLRVNKEKDKISVMNEVLLDAYTYHEAEAYAKLNNIDVAEVERTSVMNFPGKFKRPSSVAVGQKYELPPHLERLGGCLAGVSDPSDEKLNYLLLKSKGVLRI